MKRAVVIVLALVVVGAFVYTLTDTSGGEDSGRISEGSPTLLQTTLDTYEGKPVVVNYWATWCVPCKAEMPHIVAASKRYAGRVHFLGVNVEDDPQAAKDFAKEYGMTFRSLADPNKDITRAEELLGLPATQFYDADGDLAFVKQGEIKNDELIDKIEDALRASD